MQAAGTGWRSTGGAKLDNTSSPVPRGQWSGPSASLLLRTPGDGVINRGFAGEGLFLPEGKDFTGYLVLKSDGPVTCADIGLSTLGC